MLINQIKTELNQARLSQDKHKVTVLSTFLGEAVMIGKNKNRDTTDEEVVALAKKFVSGINETIKFNPPNVADLQQELIILEAYIPKQLTELDISAIISSSGINSLGMFMKHMKENYQNQYDGALVSKLFMERV